MLEHHRQSSSQGASIHLFDRGVTARLTYDELGERELQFVSRLSPGVKHMPLGAERISVPIESGQLRIGSDMDVQLYKEGGVKAQHQVRLIKSTVLASGKPRSKGKKGGRKSARKQDEPADTVIWFVTNISAAELSAGEIAALYRRR